ncbi:MAG: prephenate dehydratase [Nanobdellota archaeon]
MKISIIGGSGSTGQQFYKFFSRRGFEVQILGRKTKDYREKAEESDVLIITVPIDAVEDTLKKISKYNLKKDALVTNFSSIMSVGCETLKKLQSGCCIHPMFGPDIENFNDMNIIIAPELNNPNLKKIVEVFKKEGANITFTTIKNHDKLVAVVQALSQFSSINLAKTLKEIDINIDKLLNFSSITFRMNLKAIERILRQDAELWRNIQFLNPYFKDVLDKYKENMLKLQNIVNEKDKETFDSDFNQIKKYWHSSKETNKEETQKIGTLGPKGTYSEIAAKKYTDKEIVFYDSIKSLIKAVSEKELKEAIIPFENSIHGTVMQTIDGIGQESLYVNEEIVIDINHCIAGLPETNPFYIKEIYSHPQALKQCYRYLSSRFPNAKLIPTESTSYAFSYISENHKKDALAIGPLNAAETYNFTIYDKKIQDEEKNQTSFVVVSNELNDKGDKNLIMISPEKDSPGLLYDILKEFKKKEINLYKIESRPSKTKLGTYIFYLIIDKTDDLVSITENLKKLHVNIKNMGFYITKR